MSIFARALITTSEHVIDRIGLASAETAKYANWYVTFVGDRTIHQIFASHLSDNAHAVLAKPGDRVLVSFKKGRIVDLKNLSLIG